jgi:hypothetical protein
MIYAIEQSFPASAYRYPRWAIFRYTRSDSLVPGISLFICFIHRVRHLIASGRSLIMDRLTFSAVMVSKLQVKSLQTL